MARYSRGSAFEPPIFRGQGTLHYLKEGGVSRQRETYPRAVLKLARAVLKLTRV